MMAADEAPCGCWPRLERCEHCSSCSACCRCIRMRLAAAHLSIVRPSLEDVPIGELEVDELGEEVSHYAELQRHAILAAGYDAQIERWARRATERLRRSR